jgi:FtsP/CotA-like multicopper oxidase with cupredoxin domain
LATSLSVVQTAALAASSAKPSGKVRTYYIAADEVEWDYAPTGIDHMTGKPFEGYTKLQTERGPNRIGTRYRKAIYREYTDHSFATVKQRAADQQYLGLLGPLLRAEVGDTIKITFRNNGTHPFSMHPHGVLYDKASEGATYGHMGAKDTGIVAPGDTHIYIWKVPERAGPGPNDPSSLVWLYHSHVNEPRDVNAGLLGAMIITRRGMARPDGSPRNVEHEFVNLFQAFSEHQSWYFDHNIQTYAGDPKSVNKTDSVPTDENGNFTLTGIGFVEVNVKWSINGYIYGNMPMMTMKKGDRVRWYLVTLGEGFNFHTPHWHGNVVSVNGQRTDVVSIGPAQMVTADMRADNAGMWMYHCHVSDHMAAGMSAHYDVLP